MTTHFNRPGKNLWRWIVLTISIIVAVVSFEMEETAPLSGPPLHPPLKKRKKVLSFRGANGSSQQVPDAAELKKLFVASSTSTHKEISSSRRLIDVLKLSKRRLTDEGSLSCPNPQWTQVGMDIDDEVHGDDPWQSIAVALSADGLIMAVGATGTRYGPSDGQVRVYHRNDSSSLGWTQIGQDLIGKDSDRFGQFVALSDDGEVLAVSATYGDSGGIDSGHVRVFQRDADDWSQIGDDINGEASFDYSGDAISLSGSGDILAVGATNNNGNGDRSGHVRVYERAPSSTLGWAQIGGDLDGESSGDRAGRAVALSKNGDVVAIGAAFNDAGSCCDAGHVRVYKRDPPTALGWLQLGQDIDGEYNNILFGTSVALSDDGEVLAIGSPRTDGPGGSPWDAGYVQVYSRDSSSTLGWRQIGVSLYGDGGYDNVGSTVNLSGDGQIVAVGADGCFGGSYVRVYQRDPSTVLGWKQVGDDLDIEDELYYPALFSISVSLSNNGEVIAIGAPRRIGGICDSSADVKVFEACDQDFHTTAPTSSPTYIFPPPPPCSSGQDKFIFQMRTDNFGAEVSWQLQIKKLSNFEEYFGNGFDYGNAYGDSKGYQEKYCIPDDECYRFVIYDTVGDGLCCDRGEGGYRIKFNNEIIKESRFEDMEYESVKFNCD